MATLVWAVAVAAAHAADGRITFSGAIATPTCAMSTQVVQQVLAEHAIRGQGQCGSAGRRDTQSNRLFRYKVSRLSGAMIDPRAAEYFHDFAPAGNALLATQTYR